MLAGAAGAVLLARVLRGSGPSLAGRVVLITGGSRGLGLVLAREAAAQGARVAICARDPETLERARASLAASRADGLAYQNPMRR
jgi:NAD(P)-dependent dehydrogenase (short-subunit alcohol dehydrogenase family)